MPISIFATACPRDILDFMESEWAKETADLALKCLQELRTIVPAKALPNLRLIREYVGDIKSEDPTERANAWWELCQLCALLSSDPQSATIHDRWETTIKATEAWCATL